MPRTRNVQLDPQLTPQTIAKNVVKRPLQDITDRFVLVSPGVSRPPTAPAVSSSLPPSSPPSTSSGASQPESKHRAHPMLPLSHAFDGAHLDFQFDFESGLTFRGVQAVEAESHDSSDPFGFFAVEKKLKALRAQKQDRHRYRSVSSPQVEAKFEVEHQHLITPPTPHKKRSQRREIASPNVPSPDIYSIRTDSMPSTPSPSKSVSLKRKGEAILEEEDITGGGAAVGNLERLSMAPTFAARRKPVKRVCKERSGLSDRKPLREVATAVKTVGYTSEGKEYSEAGAGKKRGTIKESGIKVTRQKAQARGKAKAAGNLSCDNQQERWERERQERLDYFRKLQDYQIQKENVYVI